MPIIMARLQTTTARVIHQANNLDWNSAATMMSCCHEFHKASLVAIEKSAMRHCRARE
jgi:hypothetical protein